MKKLILFLILFLSASLLLCEAGYEARAFGYFINPGQLSFNAGEVSPYCKARADFPKYNSACLTLENFFIMTQGPVVKRPGTRFIAEVKDSNDITILVPFEFSKTDAYGLEFGDQYIRFYRNGGQILDANDNIYEISTSYQSDELSDLRYAQSNDVLYLVHPSYCPKKLMRYGHTSWSIADVNFIDGPFLAENILTTTTYGDDLCTGGTPSVFSSTTGTAADLFDDDITDANFWEDSTSPYPGWAKYDFGNGNNKTIRKYTLSAGDGVPDRMPKSWIFQASTNDSTWLNLDNRNNETSWSLSEKRTFEFSNSTAYRYYRLYMTAGNAAAIVRLYEIEMMEVNGLPVTVTPSDVTGTITLDASSNIFESGHEGSLFRIRHPRDDASINGVLDANESSAVIDCYGDFYLYTSGTWSGILNIQRSKDETTWETIYSRKDTNVDYSGHEAEDGYKYRVNMSLFVSGSCTYNFVVYENMHTGYVRITAYVDPNEVTATVLSELGDDTATAYWSEAYWSDKNGWPQTIEFNEQRMVFGGSTAYPQTIWFGQTYENDYEGMLEGEDDSSAIIFMLPGQNPLQWLCSRNYLFIGTYGEIGRLGDSPEGDPITPSNPTTYRRDVKHGSTNIQALILGDTVIYAERYGRKIRQLNYNLERDGFISPDMTILAEHITESGVIGLCQQTNPQLRLWARRSDGQVAILSYDPDQNVLGWSRFVTDGIVESVIQIPGSQEDEILMIVKRTIEGITRKYIEQLQPLWDCNSPADAYYVDCGLSFDGGAHVNISDINQSDPGLVTVATWPTDGQNDNLGDGDQIKIINVSGMTQVNNNIYSIDEPNVTAKTFKLRNSTDTADVNTIGYGAYTSGGKVQRFENTFTELDHLEGETVSILADGIVQSQKKVSSGSVTLSVWANKVHIGLPYTCKLQTMPLTVQTQTGWISSQNKRITGVSFDLEGSFSFSYGPDFTRFSNVTLSSPKTGWWQGGFPSGYAPEQTVCVEQESPGALTVRSIIAVLEITGN